MKYLLPMNNSYVDQTFSHIYILINCMAKFEHLDEIRQEAIEWIGTRQWNTTLWAQKTTKLILSLWGHDFLVSKGLKRTHRKVQRSMVWYV